MALEVRIGKRKLNYTEDKKEVFVATADRGSVIDTKKIARYISEETGYKPAVVNTILTNLTERMVEWMEEGHGVRFDGFGSFMPAVKSRSSENLEECGVKRVRVSFFPSRALAQRVNAINISTESPADDDDITADSGSGEGPDDNGSGGADLT